MAMSRSSRTGLATFACATLLLPACEGRGCRETEMDALDAALVDAGDATSSAVLEARLTSAPGPVRGRTVVFSVRTGSGDYEFAGSSDTDGNGVARFDLKDDLTELVESADAEAYRAAFHGDGRYCSSRDVADLDLVAAP
ncbi:MAG: Ig-like domain-containing protein [Actinomycetota bacterium]|nr:Ig-like domain-containing protein [Actinomycetota bacterium]